MKPYPFNWPEFFEWRRNEIKSRQLRAEIMARLDPGIVVWNSPPPILSLSPGSLNFVELENQGN